MLVKAAIKLIYPMLLMMVYALWIVYLVVAEFKGIAFIKGLLMIFVLKLCTSVWAIADIVGSEMMTLLYPKNEGTLDWILSMPDASIVLVATTLFYFIVPSLMMYLVAMAGGPDSKGFTDRTHSTGKETGGTASVPISGGSGGSFGKAGNAGWNKIKKK